MTTLQRLNRLMIFLLAFPVANNIVGIWKYPAFLGDLMMMMVMDPRLNRTSAASPNSLAVSNENKFNHRHAPSSSTVTNLQKSSRPRLDSATIAAMNITKEIPGTVQVFYSGTRGDRSGSVVLDMLMGHAFAWTLGRRYGGMCGPEQPTSNDHRRMIRTLGLEDELLYPEQLPPCDDTETAMKLTHDVYMFWKGSGIFEPEWIEYIQQRRKRLPPWLVTRQSQQAHSNRTEGYSIRKVERVIVHIRRGDVTPCIDEYVRYTPNSHYFHLINDNAMANNDTFYNVTIYSEADAYEGWQDFNFSHPANVECHVLLDVDMADVWSDMAGYHDDSSTHHHRTLILSSSTFSFVPAVLANPSTTTVIYTPFWHEPLRHWLVVDANTTALAAANTRQLRENCSFFIHSVTQRPRWTSAMIAAMNISMEIPDSVEEFYTGTRGDRTGAVLMDALMAHAFAWTLGRKYGGMCGPAHPTAQDHRRMIQILGLEYELPYPDEPKPCESFDGSGSGLMIPRQVYMDWKDSGIFTPEWMEYIQTRRTLPQRHVLPDISSHAQLERVIIHIRRGDVTPCNAEYMRYTPNAYYYRLIDENAKDNNDTFFNVTIYSESDSFESWQDFNFSHLPNVACELSLDSDIADVWSDMLGYNDDPSTNRALVLSASTFSFVPAMFANQSITAVIYTPYWHDPLPDWFVVSEETTAKAEAGTRKLREEKCPSQQ